MHIAAPRYDMDRSGESNDYWTRSEVSSLSPGTASCSEPLPGRQTSSSWPELSPIRWLPPSEKSTTRWSCWVWRITIIDIDIDRCPSQDGSSVWAAVLMEEVTITTATLLSEAVTGLSQLISMFPGVLQQPRLSCKNYFTRLHLYSRTIDL